MRVTPNATVIKAVLDKVGANLDAGTGRLAEIAKVSRYRLPNGRPLVLEHNLKTPNVWLLAEHENGAMRKLGTRREYETSDGKHSNLAQTPEFRKGRLVKVAVSCTAWPDLERAFHVVAGL